MMFRTDASKAYARLIQIAKTNYKYTPVPIPPDTFEYPEVAFSFHKDVIGKPIRKMGEDGKAHLFMGDKQVNLGYGWVNAELPFDELFIMLSEGGYSFAPSLKSDHRDEDNFLSHQVALVDIDSGMRIDELQQLEFYQKYGSGYYTTPSHTDTDHRFRIIYQLESPITNAEEMRQIYEGLLVVHGAADVSCKDSARLFYGTVNAARCVLTKRRLTEEGIRFVLEKRKQRIEKLKPIVTMPVAYAAPNLQEVQELLDDLRKHYTDLNYHTRFAVSRAVASAIGVLQTIHEMRTRWPDADKNGKYEDILKDPLKTDGPKLGSLVYMIREIDSTYRKRIEPVKPQWLKSSEQSATAILKQRAKEKRKEARL